MGFDKMSEISIGQVLPASPAGDFRAGFTIVEFGTQYEPETVKLGFPSFEELGIIRACRIFRNEIGYFVTRFMDLGNRFR